MAPKRTKAAQKEGRKKKRLENPATSHTDISQPQNSDASQSLTLPSSLTHEAIVESVIAVLEQKGVIPRTEQTAIPANSGTMTPDQLTTNSDHASCSHSDTIRQVQQALCPTTSDTSEGMDKTTLFTSALSPGALIPDKVRQQIWNNEYIDLGSLVDKRSNSDDITLKFSKTTQSISVMSKDENKNLSMSKWLSAFTVYMDIYLQKHPRDASGLLAYLNLVRDLERVHGVAAFNFYDKNFRAHRQVQPLAWGSLHHELWIRATTMSLAVQQRPWFSSVAIFRTGFSFVEYCSGSFRAFLQSDY